MIYFLLFTSLIVSIDSFFIGFSLSLNKRKIFLDVFVICFIVFLMCLATNYFALFLSNYFSEKISCFFGLILVIIGIINLISTKKQKETKEITSFYQTVLTGIAVGADGASLNLSLSLMNINFFYVPVIISLMHGLTIFLGILLGKTRIFSFIKKYSFIPPLILILLGIYKVLSGLL